MDIPGSFHGSFRHVEAPVECSMTAAPTDLWTRAASREAAVEAMEAATGRTSGACTPRRVFVKATGKSTCKTLKVLVTPRFGIRMEGTDACMASR